MRYFHLFEFMDLSLLPASLRATLREILECGNGWPFRSYYQWVAFESLKAARELGAETIVEVGAGTAPTTRRLAAEPAAGTFQLVPCDANPDKGAYEQLERLYPRRVFPIYEPIDFSEPRRWEDGTLLVLSATLHHLPPALRRDVTIRLSSNADGLLVFEPLQKNLRSLLFVFGSLFPALVLPAWMLRRPGRLRRVLWCWLVPVAPLMFCWDGWVSCLRQWSCKEWQELLAGLRGDGSETLLETSTFCQLVKVVRGGAVVHQSQSPVDQPTPIAARCAH